MEKNLDVICLSLTVFWRTLHHGIMADGYAWNWQDHNPETNNQRHSFQRMTSHLPYLAKETIPHAQIVTGCMQTSHIHVSTTMFCSLYTPAFQFPGNHFFGLNLTVQTLDRGHYRSVEKKLSKPKFVHSLICLRKNTETRITGFHKFLNISFHMRGPPAQCRVATMHGHRTMMMMMTMTVTTHMIKETITAQTVATIVKGKNNQFTKFLVQFQFKDICKPHFFPVESLS